MKLAPTHVRPVFSRPRRPHERAEAWPYLVLTALAVLGLWGAWTLLRGW
jgi:hypothetical protein